MDNRFKKGHDPRRNLAGRPPGESEQVQKTRELIGEIIAENLPLVRRDLKKMTAKQRALIVEKLLRFYLPTLKASEDSVKIDFNKLSDEDVEKIVTKILKP